MKSFRFLQESHIPYFVTTLSRDLKDRDLIQSRGKWRAVLPHAIANRLAKRALEAISKEKIHEGIICSGTERLIKSFTRRLSYLHDSEVAAEIVSGWLIENGWIGKAIFDLNEFGIEVLQNIAPVCPEETLNIIEKAANDPEKGEWFASRENPKFLQFVRLLRHLAYEEKTFNRSVSLITRFAVSESKDENDNSIRDYLKSLFFIYLSGTKASHKQRAEFIEELLSSGDVKRQELGLLALDAALETWHFTSNYEFGFGARSRDFGYEPKSQEILPWYETFIKLCTDHICRITPTATEAKKILAGRMRGLWINARAFDALENSVKAIREHQSWNEGWIASSSILKLDSKGMSKDVLERLHALRETLKPNDLENLARTYALTDQHFLGDLEDDFDDVDTLEGFKRTVEKTKEIGFMLAQDESVLDKLLPDLVSTHNSRLYDFGQGLGNGCTDKKNLWKKLYEQVINVPEEKRQTSFICGFLSICAEEDHILYNQILDDIVGDTVLGGWLPIFQATSTIDKRGVKRLHRSLKTNVTAIHKFHHLAYGRAHESIGDDDLADLLEEILKRENGYFPATEILKMRFHQKRDSSLHSNKLLSIARKTLSTCDFSYKRKGHLMDYALSEIATVCLSEKGFEKEAKEICDNVYKALVSNQIYGSNLKKFMAVLSEKQPLIFLESFLGNTEISGLMRNRIFTFYLSRYENPLNKIPDEVLIDWCELDSANRYPLIADSIQPYEESSETGYLVWKKIVYSLFEKAPDLKSILSNLAGSIRPNIWNGSRTDVLNARLILFEELKNHSNEEVRSWAKVQLSNLRIEIENTREQEDKSDRDINESFE